MAQTRRFIITFLAVFSFLAVNADDENLSSDEKFVLLNDGEMAQEDKGQLIDNSVDIQEGLHFLYL